MFPQCLQLRPWFLPARKWSDIVCINHTFYRDPWFPITVRFTKSYLSWLDFLQPFIFEIPARRKEFEQLCECLTQNASEEAPAPPPEPSFPPLFFLKAEKSFCQPDLLLVVIGGAEADDGVLDEVQDNFLRGIDNKPINYKIENFKFFSCLLLSVTQK